MSIAVDGVNLEGKDIVAGITQALLANRLRTAVNDKWCEQ